MWSLVETWTHNRKWARVACSCGNQAVIRLDHFTSGRSKYCKSCSSKKTIKNYKGVHPWLSAFQGVGRLSKTHYGHLKTGAEKRSIEFNVCIKFLWNLFEKQHEKCALSGVTIILENSLKDHNVNWDIITASLDRIDSKKHYTEDNVQWVHKDINRMKHAFKQERFIELCRKVTEHNGI